MPKMYPNNQTLSLFGDTVEWPGLDPVTGKFTNGSFTDPMVKPSFIPAETINLLLDNMETLIEAMGFNPNNIDPDQLQRAMQRGFAPRVVGEYHEVAFEPTIAQLVAWRWLPIEYQLIKIADYEELCKLKYCGDDKNNTALWWYKCDEDGTRNINGLWMRVEDRRGLFSRCAGVNEAVRTNPNVRKKPDG